MGCTGRLQANQTAHKQFSPYSAERLFSWAIPRGTHRRWSAAHGKRRSRYSAQEHQSCQHQSNHLFHEKSSGGMEQPHKRTIWSLEWRIRSVRKARGGKMLFVGQPTIQATCAYSKSWVGTNIPGQFDRLQRGPAKVARLKIAANPELLTYVGKPTITPGTPTLDRSETYADASFASPGKACTSTQTLLAGFTLR